MSDRDLRISERHYGGGTHHIITVTEVDPMTASARFLARQEDALIRAEMATAMPVRSPEDADRSLAALESAVRDWLTA